MKTYMLDLNSIEKVKGFVSAIEKFDGYFDIAAWWKVWLILPWKESKCSTIW